MSVCPPGNMRRGHQRQVPRPAAEDFVGMLGNLQNLLDGPRAAHLPHCNATAPAAAAPGSKAKGRAPQTRLSRKTRSTGHVRQRLQPGQARHSRFLDRRHRHAGAGGPRCRRVKPATVDAGRAGAARRPLQAAANARHQVPLRAGHRRQRPPGTRCRRGDSLRPRDPRRHAGRPHHTSSSKI